MNLNFGIFNTTTLKESNNILSTNSLCFYSDSLDDRGDEAIKTLKRNAKELIKVKYDDEKFSLFINDELYSISDFFQYLKHLKYDNIIIEATTLSIVEIVYILQSAIENKYVKYIQILYIEPEEYKFKNSSITSYDDFELSEQLKSFPPIPRFTIQVEDIKIPLIAFLGFEKARIGQIFNIDEAAYDNFYPVVPLPGFCPGWENRTINNHLKFFNSKYFFNHIKYVSANNPYHAYSLLEKFSLTHRKFRIAPIGTKPNTIGCAVFIVNQYQNKELECGLLFDFPVKIKKRSSGIGKVHIYNLHKT